MKKKKELKHFWHKSDPRVYGLPTLEEQKERNRIMNICLDRKLEKKKT